MAEWMLGGLAGSLYMYNRENFIFDKTLSLKREYQGQEMRMKQFGLYREDVRDLMNLTVSKMDNYLLVSTLQLGFCITIITEGRPGESRAAPWLVWLYATTLMGAFLYFLLSAWLAIHASIAAHSFGVRMLTQFVRLPVPNRAQLDAARSYAADYEGLSIREMLRIPVVRQQFRRLNAAMDNLTSQDVDTSSDAFSHMESNDNASVLEAQRSGGGLPQHTRLYRELQANWQAYDAYARVCMALGTNQMMYALGYELLHMLILRELSPEPALACVVVCAASAWLLARLDLYLSRRLLTLAGVLLVLPPALSLVSLAIQESESSPFLKYVADLLILLIFMMHIVWIVFIVYIAKADSFGSLRLPRNFRTVLYLDVFGQMEAAPEQATVQDQGLDSSALTAISAARGLDDNSGVLPPLTEDPQSFSSEAGQERLTMRRQESGGSLARQRSSSVGSSLGRPELRLELAGLCRRLQAELQRDLLRWEGAQLAQLVGPDGYECSFVARLRAESDTVAERLEALAPGSASGVQGSKDCSEGTATRAWLKLEWNPSGNPTEFFYCCDSGDVAWIHPREPDVVLELQALEGQLAALANKVEALAELQPAEPAEVESALPPMEPEWRPPQPQPQPLLEQAPTASTQLPPVTSTGSSARPASSRSVAFSADARSSGLRLDSRAPEDEDEGPAQETRFGGQEALQGQSFRDAFALSSDSASQSFHPHRSAAEGFGQGVRQRRPPGQLPWHTFLKGSIMLIAVWIIGLLWVICKVLLRIDIPVGPPPPPEPDLRLVAPGPHPFFSATGLACHEASRSLFVTEKYAVHKLHLDAVADLGEDFATLGATGADDEAGQHANATAQLTALQPAFTECLAQAPDFHARGLRGVAVECAGAEDDRPTAHRCSALLLGAGGHGALRCALGAEAPGGAVPARVAAFGGPWRGFLPSSGGGEAVWADRESDGAIVMLQRSFGTDSTLVPQFEVPQNAEDGPTHFHVLEDSGMVLGLEPDGLLRARPLAGGAASWSRRLGAGRRWLGLCAAGEDLFLLGAPAATPDAAPSPAAVWRLPLPQHLRRPRLAAV